MRQELNLDESKGILNLKRSERRILQQLNHNRTKAWTKVEMERKGCILEIIFGEQSTGGLIGQKVRASQEILLEDHMGSAVISNRQFQIPFDHF